MLAGYRTLRQLLTGPRGIAAIVRRDAMPLNEERKLRADQYGIRTAPLVGERPIKFEIVLEGRVELAAPTPRDGWLERCILAMAINLPKAQIWPRIRALRRILSSK